MAGLKKHARQRMSVSAIGTGARWECANGWWCASISMGGAGPRTSDALLSVGWQRTENSIEIALGFREERP